MVDRFWRFQISQIWTQTKKILHVLFHAFLSTDSLERQQLIGNPEKNDSISPSCQSSLGKIDTMLTLSKRDTWKKDTDKITSWQSGHGRYISWNNDAATGRRRSFEKEEGCTGENKVVGRAYDRYSRITTNHRIPSVSILDSGILTELSLSSMGMNPF